MMELVKMMVVAIGYAVLSISFLFGACFLFVITKRTKRIDFYRQMNQKSTIFKLADILLQGILAGTVITSILIFVGIPLYFNLAFIMLIPLSILLSMIRIRYLCIAYSASILGLTSLIFQGQQFLGYELPNFELHIPSLVIFVGLLHVCEGILIFVFGEKEAIPIVSRKGEQILGGHILHMTWLIPLGLLLMQIGGGSSEGVQMPSWWPYLNYEGEMPVFYFLLPLVGFLSHHSISFTQTPKKFARRSGFLTAAYGLFTVFVGVVSKDYIMVRYMGVFLLAGLHEVVYFLEMLKEKNAQPIYSLPSEGVRVIHIVEGGIADKIGMEVGDIIEQIDGISVQDLRHFIQLLKEAKNGIRVNIKRLSGMNSDLTFDESFDIRNIGIRVIPEKPMILYPFHEFRSFGMLAYLSKIHVQKK